MKDFFDVYYQAGENPSFCYRSGLTVYEEVLYNGVLTAAGWNSAGYPLNVLSNCPTRVTNSPRVNTNPFAFNLEINGRNISYDLEFVDFKTEKNDKNVTAILTLKSKLLPVQIEVYTLLDGTPMFTRKLIVKNLSEDPMCINKMGLQGGMLEECNLTELQTESKNLYSVGYFTEDEWGREGQFAFSPLQREKTVIQTRFGRERFRHPALFIKNNVTGALWFTQAAWSGGCEFGIDYRPIADGTKTYLFLNTEITGYNPLLVLKPNEEYSLPEVHTGMVQGDLDDAINGMHEHIRRSVLNMPEADPSACLIGCGMGAEHDMSVETSKSFIDQFSQMGGEIFIIDAGWQNPPSEEMKWKEHNGKNVPDKERYPNGIEEISDYCRKKGMKFALWVEIERLGDYSDAYKNHPDWRAKNIFGETETGLIDITVPEAAKWVESELARIITEYKLDLLRVDFNVSAFRLFNMSDTGTGIKECLCQRYFQAVYNIYRNLKKQFPNVIFENCAGGGGRTDLGMMKAFNHTWVSDWQKMPRSIAITNGMTMVLPPERVDRLFAGMECHKTGSLDAHMRNTMLGHMSLNVISPASATINTAQMEFIQHSVQVYKDFIRPILPGCKVYHHTPEVKDIAVLEISNGGKGAVSIFALAGQKEISLRLKGTEYGKKYRITLDNSGAVFEVDGKEKLDISLTGTYTSELVLYEEISKED